MRRNAGRQHADRVETARRLAVLVEAAPELRDPEALAAAFEYITGFRPAQTWLAEIETEVEQELARRRQIPPRHA